MNMRKVIFSLLGAALLFGAPAAAQRTAIRITTIANLPSTCEPEGHAYIVTDATSASDCVTGASSTIHWCFCNAAGTGYDAQPGGVPGTDSVGTVELDDGADTPLAGEWVQVDAADTTQFLYRTDAELITDSGAAPLDSPTFTTAADSVTPPIDDNDTSIATTAFVQAETFGGDVSGTMSTTQVDDVQTATTNLETTGNNTTQVSSTSFVQQELLVFEKAWYHWSAFELFVDGTQCNDQFGSTINSGATMGVFKCADNAASEFQGSVLLEEYAGGTLIFTLEALSVNATPTGILDFDFKAACRGDSDLMNDTWSGVQNASITFSTQNDYEQADTAAITPDGTCAAGDRIWFQATMDDVATTEVVADVRIFGVSVQEQ